MRPTAKEIQRGIRRNDEEGRKEKDERISEEKGEEKGERKDAKGSSRRKRRHSIWFGSSFAKVDKVTADDLIGRGEEGDDTFYEGRGRRTRLLERKGGGGKEEEREKGKRKRQKERSLGNQDDSDSPRDFCPSLPDRQDDLDDFLKARERKSSCQTARSSVPTGEILHFPPGPILPYQLRPRQASPDRKVPLHPPKPASLENKLRQHHPRRRTSLETIEEDPLTFVFRESRMRSYPHEADLTCCVGEASQPPGFLLTRSVTFSDLTWQEGEGDDPGSGAGNVKGSMEESGNDSVANEGGPRKGYFGNVKFENDFDDATKTADDATVHIGGERRDHSSYGMTVSVYGVCDVHRAPLFARLHDVTRDEVPEVLQGGLEEVFVGWQEDDTDGMLADLFREEDEDRGIDRAEKERGDEERGKSDCREKGSWIREDNGEVNDRGGTEYTSEGNVQEMSIENRLEIEGNDENEKGYEGVSERTENEAKGKRKENGEGESQPPIPQLSFHIYIQQQKSVSDDEYPSEERGPGERNPQEVEPTNEESSKSEDENHETPSEAGGNEARGRPNEAPAWLRQQYRMDLMGGKIPEHRIVPDLYRGRGWPVSECPAQDDSHRMILGQGAAPEGRQPPVFSPQSATFTVARSCQASPSAAQVYPRLTDPPSTLPLCWQYWG
ncbi:uncharacterized protein LOC125042467 [Penaeus chinensis]|uniref:uncharacterized protein LOC125042467 n=1 Tax=Penaeus chinensis TaxID=139456 RepID=UPI001FB69669|nr:uncharacterized protein LOC125042467 [Penaeus chinensis]